MTDPVSSQSQTSPSSSPAAGWYPDPQGQGLRWWDGSTWTEHTHDEAAANGSAAASTTTATATSPAVSNAPAASTESSAKPAKADGKKRVSFINDHAVAILVALAVLLAVIVALQVL